MTTATTDIAIRKHRLSALATLVAHERNLRILPGDTWASSPNDGTLTYPIDELAKLDYDSATGLMWRAASMVVNGVHERQPYNAVVDAGIALSKQYGSRVLHPKLFLPTVVRAETARIERVTRSQSRNLSATYLPPLGSKHRASEAAEILQRAAAVPKSLDQWWQGAAEHVTLAAAGIPRPANPAYAHLPQLESLVQPLLDEKSYDDLLAKLEPLSKAMVDAYLAFKAQLPPPPPPQPQQQPQQNQKQTDDQDGDTDDDSTQGGASQSDDAGDDTSDDDGRDSGDGDAPAGESNDDGDQTGAAGDEQGDDQADDEQSASPDASDGAADPNVDPAVQQALDELARDLAALPNTPLHVDMINGTVGTSAPAAPVASPDKATWIDYAFAMKSNIETVRSILLQYLSETETSMRERGLRSGRVDVHRIGALVNGTSDAVFCRRTLPGDTSVDVVLLLDISLSTKAHVDQNSLSLIAERYHAIRAFAVTFAEALQTIPDARLSVIRFDDDADAVLDFGDSLTPQKQEAVMRSVFPRGNTDLNPALRLAAQALRNSDSARKLVFVATDGVFGSAFERNAIAALGDADISIFTLDCPAEEAHRFIDARHVSRIESTSMRDGIESQFRRIFG